MTLPDSRRARTLATIALLGCTAVLYLQVSGFDFLNYDDQRLLRDNPYVNTGLSLRNLAWAFTSTNLLQWAPITWISHMLDFQVFGTAPSGHHVTSAILHLLNTLGLLLFLASATRRFWPSAFVAALFAVHPLHVEPVAWLSARKDLVSTGWVLVALLAYTAHARRPAASRFLASLAAYALSLMSKPMYVTLPFLLLMLDHWPLGRFEGHARGPGAAASRTPALRNLLLEKVPFVVLAVVFSAIGYVAQSDSGAITPLRASDLPARVAMAAVALGRYVWQAVWPAQLAVVYPRTSLSPLETILSLTFLASVSVAVGWHARSRGYLAVGWFWFLVTLAPVLGLVQIGPAMMADKYMYFPLVGLGIMAAWGAADLAQALEARVRAPALAGAAALALALCAGRSWEYLACWKNSIALYTKALEVTQDNFIVLGNLGSAYSAEGRFDEAIRSYQAAIQAEPRFELGYANIGFLLMSRGDCEQAVPYLAAALRLNPEYQRARSALAYCQGGSSAGR